jgi:hypothetical protein
VPAGEEEEEELIEVPQPVSATRNDIDTAADIPRT